MIETIKENTNKELVVIAAMQKKIVAMKEITQDLHKQQQSLQKQWQKEIEIFEVKKEWQKEIEISEVKKEWQKKIEVLEEERLHEREHLVNETDALTTQVAVLLSEREDLVNKNDTLTTEIEKLSNEKDCLTKSLKQTEDEVQSLVQQNRRTISDMGLLWLMRILSPRHLAVDGCFLIFGFAFLYNKIK